MFVSRIALAALAARVLRFSAFVSLNTSDAGLFTDVVEPSETPNVEKILKSSSSTKYFDAFKIVSLASNPAVLDGDWNAMRGRTRLAISALGAAGVGKSSALHRFQTDLWEEQLPVTIGVDFASKVVKHPETSSTFSVILVDTAGQERCAGRTQ